MAQTLYIDNRDGFGLRDFTKFITPDVRTVQFEKNEPTLFDFNVVKAEGVTGWVLPRRGAYVRMEDPSWLSRDSGVPDGVIFTGYITEDPEPSFLGSGPNDTPTWVYQIRCTSDEYIANSKTLPQRTYINKPRGFILRDLLDRIGVRGVLDTSGILDGGTERIFQVDPVKKWSEIAKEFAEADGFVYRSLYGKVLYYPEREHLPNSPDPSLKLVIDEQDPRYTPDNVAIVRVGNSISNDVTVIGANEATTYVEEHFVSDGYQGEHHLAHEPYGLEETVLVEDDLTGDIDTSIWEEHDHETLNHIRAFEGTLNVVGGGGIGNPYYLRSRKGVELSGIIDTLDGEIFFAPGPTGVGIIGGLYSSEEMTEASLWCGWKIDLNARTLKAFGPNGLEAPAIALNENYHYKLRRIINVNRPPQPTKRRGALEVEYEWGTDEPAQSATIVWAVDTIVTDDPENLAVIPQVLLSQTYQTNLPSYALYAPVVTYDAHFAMNFVRVARPSQVEVWVARPGADYVRLRVGSYISGGLCDVGKGESGSARLFWYALQSRPGSATNFLGESTAVTVPPQGSRIRVRYRRSSRSMARMKNNESILLEKSRFGDDGLRQKVLYGGSDVNPEPRSSKECELIAKAYLDDSQSPTYEGSYAFECGENDPTRLKQWVYPGDLVPCSLDLPLELGDEATQINQRLSLTTVEVEFTAKGAYRFELSFGPLNRFLIAQRELLLSRKSLLDEPSLQAVEPIDALEFSVSDSLPFDPAGASLSSVTTTTATIAIQIPSGAAAVDGFEVRDSDSGWGKGGYVLQTASTVFSLGRSARDRTYYVRAYKGAFYSRTSAMVRVVYPLANTMQISAITSEITPELVTINIPIPRNPDLGGIIVWHNNTSGTVVYHGDGVSTLNSNFDAQCFVESGNFVIEVPNPSPVVYTPFQAAIAVYDILGSIGTVNTFAITRTAPVITVAPHRDASNPNIWKWDGTAYEWQVLIFEHTGTLLRDFIVPGSIKEWNVGDGLLGRVLQVIPRDAWGNVGAGSAGPGGSNQDTGVPSAPVLSVSIPTSAPGSSDGALAFNFSWTTPAVNFRTIIKFQGQIADNVGFVGAFQLDIANNMRGHPWYEPNVTRFFRIRAVNSYGDGAWSNIVGPLATGSALAALVDPSPWDFLNPYIGAFIKAGGPTSHLMSSVDDGTNRSLAGFFSNGDVQRHLVNAIMKLDPIGTIRQIIREDHEVTALTNGPTVNEGASRGNAAIHNAGSGTYQLNANWRDSFGQFDPLGNVRPVFRLNFNNHDNINDGFTFVRVSVNNRDGGARAFGALRSDGFITTGFFWTGLSALVPTSVMYDADNLSVNCLAYGGAFGFRITDQKIDDWSLQPSCVFGGAIQPTYRSTAGLPDSGSGFNPEI